MSSSAGGRPYPIDSEWRHRTGGSGWSECHRLLTVDDGGALAVAMLVGIRTDGARDVASFHCAVFRGGRQPVVIVDEDVPAPDERWELRTSGLWSDNICEIPFEHWSYGLEAFGVAIDDPDEMLGRGYGDRVALGWELEFEGSAEAVVPVGSQPPSDPTEIPTGTSTGSAADTDRAGAYTQVGRADGLVLFKSGSEPLTGPAVRQHWWGGQSWPPPETVASLDGAAAVVGGGRPVTSDPDHVRLPVGNLVWRLASGVEGLRSRTD